MRVCTAYKCHANSVRHEIFLLKNFVVSKIRGAASMPPVNSCINGGTADTAHHKCGLWRAVAYKCGRCAHTIAWQHPAMQTHPRRVRLKSPRPAPRTPYHRES